ncbi:MAG: DNA methyltransferase [Blastocatellia bacterium]|nr:DNA methyltransferase [Blastocatellia bacterium]
MQEERVHQKKFQDLLRELFEFDCAELDFGIYRIMNHKRAVIEQFISKDLPEVIADELASGALAEQGQARKVLDEARNKVIETLGDSAFTADGSLKPEYHSTPVGKAYLEALAKAQGARSTEALETDVYNHLYTFFSRYWQDGDFISKRRYSRKERYAIPYNGEEVYLYWANHDQYYIKTGEYFTDYSWKAPNGVTVHFKLQQADVEQNNIKGEKRFFLPVLDSITWDETEHTLTIPFHFRPLTEQEAIAYGQKNQQESIIAKTKEEIPGRVKALEQIPEHSKTDILAALTTERRKTEKGESVSWLEHHLRQYTRRNTSDFFIHKDLRGFLSRELDFYLKNEVLNLEEMEAAGEHLSEGWFQLMRLIKRIGLRIIEFLAQIEDFQKMLWEKKKFVTETFYVITVGNIPQEFYPEIATCEAQWAEWEQLGLTAGNAGVSPANPGSAGVSLATPLQHKGWYTRGYLPHFDSANVLQFITFRLHDSVPEEVIKHWKQELHWHEQLGADSKEAVELRKRIEKYQDSGKGACYLRDERIAHLVQDALKHFDGERYRLIAWCIMPNHVHVLIEMMDEPLQKIIQSWKSYTAHEANKILGERKAFWSPDYFDRYIRDEKHFNATVEYILQNPVKAGLVDSPEKWPWCGYIAGNAGVSPASGPSAFTGGRDVRDPRTTHRIEFLKAHPTLPLDTRHFPPEFTDRLLASFDNLDERTDGLLIHSENWQALNLLQEKYRDRVKCIYIDPPYNTAASEILYKNDYKHSSWLALLAERIILVRSILESDGQLCIAIDDSEFSRLHLAIQTLLGADSILGTVAVRSNPAGRSALTGFSVSHDYAIFVGVSRESTVGELAKSDRQIARYSESDAKGQFEWVNFRKHGGLNANRFARPKLFYPIYAGIDGRVRIPAMEWNEASRSWIILENPTTQETVVWPIDERGGERTWKWGHETVMNNLSELTARPDRSGRLGVYMKSRMRGGTLPPTLWVDSKYSAADYGTNLLGHILGNTILFSFPKSIYTVGDSLRVCNLTGEDLTLDYFAGSGTTGHAVINLNREDGGRRKFILVEMAHYFDTVLLPRIKKVTFSPEWKDGKPKRMATAEEAERSPRIVKVIRLESYEDALNNLTFDDQSGMKALELFKDEYLLRYMLRWETRKSETLLDVEKLQTPFSYKLRIHRDGETRERLVDLPETFNYLLGLDVQTRKVYMRRRDACDPREAGNVDVPAGNADVSSAKHYLIYRGTLRNGRTVAVIWRDTQGWNKEDYERDRDFVAEEKLTDGAEEVFVNGDSFIPDAQALDVLFKERMFAGVEG